MNPIEKNIIYSFNLAKRDIMGLQQNVVDLAKNQSELKLEIHELRKEIAKLTKKKEPKTKTVTTRKKANFIASKTGSKFHNESCPFGKNIKPKMKLNFNSKTKALNKGLKPCNCVRK